MPAATAGRSLAFAVVLVGGSAGWTFVSAAASGGDPWPAGALLVGAATIVVAAYAWSRFALWAVPLAVVVANGALIGIEGISFGHGPLDPPLGYENANGALLVQATAAATMVAAAGGNLILKALGGISAAGFAALTVGTGSTTAIVTLAMLGIAIVLPRSARSTRAAAAAGVSVAGLALIATTVLGMYAEERWNAGVIGFASTAVDGRRLALWSDSVGLMHRNPVFGVGPGRFAVESDVASADRDTRWAHNEFLQFGAETGIPGLVLLAGGISLAFMALARSDGGGSSVIAAAALAAAALHANIDYIWHFPAIPLATAALVGAGTASLRGRDEKAQKVSDRMP